MAQSTPSRTRTPIAVAYGDGIGPEIMDATLRVLDAAGAHLALHPVEIGKKVYERGITAGITPEAWDAIRTTGVFLKAPITTPQGGGYKSLNVTTRKTLGLYANVRPCVSYTPFLRSKHPGMDVVIVRENEEDTYGGIEHQQTAEVTQCLKLITRPGCEKIVRHAFEYAVKNGRKRVSCFTKDNIMKATDGLFHKVFNEIAPQYPDIETDHWIIDIGAARLADTPEMFDVIVTPNLYGDILSDIAAQVAGSVGLVGTANIGPSVSMFEAIHGSAPDIAGMDIANPTALILASVQMLIHIGKPDVAERVHNAWLATIEDGVHTRDVFNPGHTRELVGTQGFADAVIARLGQQPESLPPVSYSLPQEPAARASEGATPVQTDRPRPAKKLVGVDLFMDWGGGLNPQDRDPEKLAEQLRALEPHCGLKLQMITNRGVKVWPQGMPETFCTDHWRCRFIGADDLTHPAASVTPLQIVHLQQAAAEHRLDFIKTEHLCTFDGTPGFSLGQGQ
ncbi:MAG: NADP-dependent isocitrate dehydrogenase [Planctomycetota bacterium]